MMPFVTSLASPVSCKLDCHPHTPSRSVDSIEVQLKNRGSDVLALSFVLHGDLASLCLPEQRQCQRADKLWEHTVFEVFLMAGNGPDYREYNFSPSGEWATYAFRDYRQASSQQSGAVPDEPAPLIRVQQQAQRLTLHAEVPLEFPPMTHSQRLGLSAVVEAADGSMSYWALRHPHGKPDFHHIDAFALQLDWP